MFEEPLFQDNILPTMYKFFSHYLSYQNWAWQYLAAMIFLYVLYKLLMYKNTVTYPPFFPTEKYYFSFSQTTDKLGLMFLFICFSIYTWYLFFQEQSFFVNYDTMSSNTMRALKNGILPLWGVNGRFSPISFWDVNIIYAITHNFILINLYIITQVLLICFLLWKLLSFMPINKRSICIGFIIISPAFFWINLVSYPEHIVIIFFLLSLLYLKNYSISSNKISSLWWGILWANMTIYTKENAILVYFGILLYSFLINTWRENITLKSFIHPIKSMRQFPMETLIFISLLIFSLFYLVNVSAITDSQYLSLRRTTLVKMLRNYIFEISILFLAVIIYAFEKQKYFLFSGLLLGSAFSLFFMIFVLKLSPITSQMEAKTYYLILPYLTSFVIIMTFIKNKKLYTFFLMLFLLIIILKNNQIHLKEEGKYYHQISTYLLSQTQPLSIFISEYSETYPWWASCWSSVHKYYAPKKNITFTTNSFNHNQKDLPFLYYWKKNPQLFHPIEYQKFPKSEDYYVIKKTDKYTDDLAVIRDMKHELVYQNKLFEVYKIK